MDPVALLRLVSEPTRHRLLTRLVDGERSVAALAQDALATESNVSHHLRLLRDVGLVAVRQQGRLRLYRLAHREVARLLQQVEALAARLEQIGLGLPEPGGFAGYG